MSKRAPRRDDGDMSMLTSLTRLLPRSWIKAVGRLQWRHPALKRVYDWGAARVRRGDRIVARGVGQGLRFNASGSNAGYVLGTSEPHVQEALALLVDGGDVVYDIGANVGFFSILAARLTGPKGHVVAFDPLADNAERIIHNSSLNGFDWVEVRTIAVGREDGDARFLVSEVSSWGRLASTGRRDGHTGETGVRVQTLDSIVASGTRPPQVVKIDVEGAEADVLDGARATIQAHGPRLVLELHGTNAAVADRLDSVGYVSVVIGQTVTIRDAPWNANIVAFPAHDQRTRAHGRALASLGAT